MAAWPPRLRRAASLTAPSTALGFSQRTKKRRKPQKTACRPRRYLRFTRPVVRSSRCTNFLPNQQRICLTRPLCVLIQGRMPRATLDAIVFRSTDPVKRAIDIVCLVILQLLTLMVLAAEQDPEKLRNHRARGPSSILARLDAGETFDLPHLWVAAIRSVASEIRADLRLGSFGVEQSGASIPTSPQNPVARTKAPRRRSTSQHRPACPTRGAPFLAPHAPNQATARSRGDPRAVERIGLFLPRLTTPNSLRYSND
jgi:hypothetical protein